MLNEKINRSKLLQVRLTLKELEKISHKFAHSISRKLSDYVRKKLLDKAIGSYTSNQSLDDCMTDMISLAK